MAKFDEHSAKLDEHTQILKALEHLTRANKANMIEGLMI